MEALTPRTVACGILLGTAVCVTNVYFGLQAGMVNSMPMQSALLAFAVFRGLPSRLAKPLTPPETTVIEVVAASLGLAPFTLGLTSFIPALQFLATPEENGPMEFSTRQLLLWATATCGLGIVAGVPFRSLFIFRERLLYPSATATGTLIGLLFHRPDIIDRAKPPQEQDPHASRASRTDPADTYSDGEASHETDNLLTEPTPSGNERGSPDSEKIPALQVLLYALTGSICFSFVAYFLPILHHLPIFGVRAARHWLWSFDLSPAYVGYGIIIDPTVNAYILLGAVVGWGVLSPIAKLRSWAPGAVDDFDNGARGWILWVGLGFILGDIVVALVWICFRSSLSNAAAPARSISQRLLAFIKGQRHELDEHTSQGSSNTNGIDTNGSDYVKQDEGWSASALVTSRLVFWTGATVLVIYFTLLLTAFSDLFSASAVLLAVFLIPLAGFISMRSLGETDNGASLAIGRLGQFAIALLFPLSSPKFTTANLLLGGTIESGASQASQQMGGFKTGFMTTTAPRAVFFAYMIGSYAGALIATVLYKTYTSVKRIPSQEFGVPDAHLYILVSRLIRQQGLPPGVAKFIGWAFILGALFSMARIIGVNRRWHSLVPSGVAVAIGMYVVPAITLPRALGGLIFAMGTRWLRMERFNMTSCATGLILGQALFSLVALLFDTLR